MRTCLPAALLLAALIALTVSRHEFLFEPLPEECSFDRRAFEEKLPEFDDVLLGMRRFDKVLRQTKGEVLDGSLSLPEAGDRLAAAAQRDNPRFLKGLAALYPGRTESERMVLTLLQHFAVEEEHGYLTPVQRERVSQLRNSHK